jgi:hypothetical protein
MDTADDCRDNAISESFFGMLDAARPVDRRTGRIEEQVRG